LPKLPQAGANLHDFFRFVKRKSAPGLLNTIKSKFYFRRKKEGGIRRESPRARARSGRIEPLREKF